MKINDLDDILIQILRSSIESGDSGILLDSFNEDISYIEKLDSVFMKISISCIMNAFNEM